MEYLDIVSENDKVIGRKSREEVHDKHLIHRGVHVFVIDKKGKILLQKRSMKKDYYPGYFDASIGAQVLSGETYEQAAIREAREELGIVVKKIKRLGKYKSFSERQHEIRSLFTVMHEGPFNINKNEVEVIEWRSVDYIQRSIVKTNSKYTEGFKLSFNLYLRSVGVNSRVNF